MRGFCIRLLSRRMVITLTAIGLLFTTQAPPVKAGEPVGDVGPMNPTMFECVDDDGTVIELDTIQDLISNDPSTETSSCTDNFEGISDFGFNTTDSVLFEGYLKDLDDECDDEGGDLRPVRRTRIAGIVYEFHPVDPNNPEQSEWQGVPSRDVPVFARGIGFESVWGSEKDGSFSFDNLGAGPIELNLGLPPDAHPINPGLIVKSTGREEEIPVFLSFYRGDLPAPDISQLRPIGEAGLPFAAVEDIVLAHRCGLPMPNVGGTPPPERPTLVIILAVLLLTLLPVGGFLTVRQSRINRNRTD